MDEHSLTTLKKRGQAAQAYTSHPALLRLEELATLRQLASSGNARLCIDFQKSQFVNGEQAWEPIQVKTRWNLYLPALLE